MYTSSTLQNESPMSPTSHMSAPQLYGSLLTEMLYVAFGLEPLGLLLDFEQFFFCVFFFNEVFMNVFNTHLVLSWIPVTFMYTLYFILLSYCSGSVSNHSTVVSGLHMLFCVCVSWCGNASAYSFLFDYSLSPIIITDGPTKHFQHHQGLLLALFFREQEGGGAFALISSAFFFF